MKIAAPVALLSLAACATPFRADVARFQAMPAPQGQSFFIQPTDQRLQGGLEFATYAQLVGQRLAAQGYQQAADAKSATLVVLLDYGVDNGREKVVTSPGFGGGYGPWGPGFGWGGYGRWGYRLYYFGLCGDPFWGGGWGDGFGGGDVSSYTVYTSHLSMRINRAVDGQSLFEGEAKARSRGDDLTRLVPNLVEAMFTNFPGRSGEVVKITVPPPPREG